MKDKLITDCGQDGCGECDVCRYLDFLDWCNNVAGGIPSVIQHNPVIEAHLDANHPGWR